MDFTCIIIREKEKKGIIYIASLAHNIFVLQQLTATYKTSFMTMIFSHSNDNFLDIVKIEM